MDDDAVLIFDPPELVWRGVRLNKVGREERKREERERFLCDRFLSSCFFFFALTSPLPLTSLSLSLFEKPPPRQPQTAKLTIISRLNASLDLDIKPAGSGRDRIRVLPPFSQIILPPRGTASVEVEVAVDGGRFAPGPMRLKAATEGIRDALWVKGLYFDMKVPATWFLDGAESMTTKKAGGVKVSNSSPLLAAASLSRSPAKFPRVPMPSTSPVKGGTSRTMRIAAGRPDGDSNAAFGGHASPASLSEDDDEVEGRDWAAPPAPPAPSSRSHRHEIVTSSDLFGDVEGPIEIDQSWLGGGGVESDREQEEDEEERGEAHGGGGGDKEQEPEDEDFALPPMPAFGSSGPFPAAEEEEESIEGGRSSPLRAVDELLSSQDRRARGPRQVLRAQKEKDEEELFGEKRPDDGDDDGEEREVTTAMTPAAATAPRPPPPHLLHPPATAVSRAAALEAVLAQQEGANAELRARVRDLASALEEARASAAAAERRALAATVALKGNRNGDFPSCSSSPSDSSLLLAQERAERQARDAAVLKLLRAKDDAFAALEVKAADAAARASEERRGREAAERERDSLAARVRSLSAELDTREERARKGGGEEATTASAGAGGGDDDEQESKLVSSLRRSLADSETKARELESELSKQRSRAQEATRTAEDAAQRAEFLTSRLEAAVAAAAASSAAASPSTSAAEASAAAAAAAAFSSYRKERHADALRFEAAVYSGLASLSSFAFAQEEEDICSSSGGNSDAFLQQHQQRLLLLSTSQPLPPPLPPSTAGNLAAALEAALAVDGATSSSRERAVREATASAAAAARSEAEEAARARAKRKIKARKEAAEGTAAAGKERAEGLERELEERERVLRELRAKAEELQAKLARMSETGGGEEAEEKRKENKKEMAISPLLGAVRCSLRSALRSAEAMRSAARACDDTARRAPAAAASAPVSVAAAATAVEEAARVAGLSIEEVEDILGVRSEAAVVLDHDPPLPLSWIVASALDDAAVAVAGGKGKGGEGEEEEEDKSRRVAAVAEAVASEAATAEGALADSVARLALSPKAPSNFDSSSFTFGVAAELAV